MGFGADTPGGTGGKTLWVTTLADGGPGSLREALAQAGPRIVRFAVGGLIELQTGLTVTEPYLTLDGSDAAVTLKNHPDNNQSALTLRTHDVIVRHLRSRPGPGGVSSSNLDALQILGPAHDILIEHCSLSWAVDEVLSTWYDAQDVTIRWCIIAEGLRDSNHSKGPHSTGALLGYVGAGNISFHHNLLAQCSERGPRVNELNVGILQVVNNIVFNCGVMVMSAPGLNVNAIGNWWIGPPSPVGIQGQANAYLEGNLCPSRPTLDGPEEDCATSSITLVDEPHPASDVGATDVYTAYDNVLAGAGAQPRDTIDARIVADVQNGTARIIDHPDEVGGWEMAAEDVQAKADAFHVSKELDVATLQASYQGTHGRYFQGVRTHQELPADDVASPVSKTARPTDQAEDWNDFGLILPDNLAHTYEIHAYDGPAGAGYVVLMEFEYSKVHWRRAINYGPEAHLTAPWHVEDLS